MRAQISRLWLRFTEAAIGSREAFASFLVAWAVFMAIVWTPIVANAQTVMQARKGADSVLLIFKAKQCTTACDSVLQVQWQYGGRVINRTVQPRAVDTVRVMRVSFADSARAFVLPLKTVALKPIAIAAYVVPVVAPPITPPVVSPPVTVPNTAPSGGWVQPIAPAAFTIASPVVTRTVRVAAGQDLQAVLNAAQPGDEIVLADGAQWTGNYTLPRKSNWVVVRSETCTNPGVRADSAKGRAVIQTPNSAAALRGGAFWWFECTEVAAKPGTINYGLIVLGDGTETTLAAMPTDMVFDRMYVHGSLTDNLSRCFAFNGIRLAVIDSWIGECHAKGQDAQGVGGWNGPGPYLIRNNRIEASGQGVMFGGADPRIVNVSPSDITITRNYIFKPLTWGKGKWSVKAAFELKHGKRVLFEGNVIENHWADSQTGFAILFQTLADNNTSWAWTTVSDVLVQNNLIRNSTNGINMLGRVSYNCVAPCQLPTNPTARVAVINNLWDGVGLDPFGSQAGATISAQLLGDLQDVTLANNTFTLPGGRQQKVLSLDGLTIIDSVTKKPTPLVQTRATIIDNVFPASTYGITGNGIGGFGAVARYLPGGVFLRNTVPGLSASGFAAGALDNGAGVDMARLNAAIAGVVR